jgi:hypothetical protein
VIIASGSSSTAPTKGNVKNSPTDAPAIDLAEIASSG